MADAVTSQTIFDGDRKCIMKFTNVSDGTGESAVLKVDVSTLNTSQGRTCTSVAIEKIEAVTFGMGVDILWDATADVVAISVGADQFQTFDFTRFGGLTNNSGAGKTGDVLFTTFGHSAGDRYSIVLEMIKNY